MYKLEDLDKAGAELRSWEDRFERYNGNNPDKYQADIKAARRRVRIIEEYLKHSWQIELTPQEKLYGELDKAFPSAKSREIVEYKERRYQRRFFPLERSRSGKTVTCWGREWIDVTHS